MVVGCVSMKDPNQNIIGEVIGDNFALVRIPFETGDSGVKVVVFSGADFHDYSTAYNNYSITRSFAGFGGPDTIDLKVTPGTHEFTVVWYVTDSETLTTTQSYDFKTGKWYEFKNNALLDTNIITGSTQVHILEGTLEAGEPIGETEEVLVFEIR
jgi:hypothetical protein